MGMIVNVQVSSLNVPGGTILYVNVVGSGALYPYTSNAIAVIGGHGSCLKKIFSFPGDTLVGVVNTDASGTPVFAGQ